MAFLKIMTGELSGMKFEIESDELTIGRASENNIVLSEAAVSSKHCAIKRDGKKFSICDLNSTNGTKLNNNKVGQARLTPKDLLTVGGVQIMFDGTDVELDTSTRSTRVFQVEEAAAEPTTSSAGGPPPFNKKKDSKLAGILLIGVVVLVVLALVVWFILRIFSIGKS